MRLEALIFDVDGTLAETEEAHRQAFNEVFSEAGLGWHWDVEDYRELLKTTGGKERIVAFQEQPGAGGQMLSTSEIAGLHKIKTARYAAILARGRLQLRVGVADLIAAARDAGLRLAVATTTNRPNVEALCQCCWGKPAGDIFEIIAAGDQVANKKPAPDVFLLALRKLGITPDRALAFEDSRNGLLSARAAGLKSILTPSKYTSSDDFTDADWLIPDLAAANLPPELSRAIQPVPAG